MTIHVLGLGGSLRSASTSRAALHLALRGAAAAGATVEALDVRELALPLFDPDRADAPPGARLLVERAAAAHAMIWSSPTYHGTVSGAFKNALDWIQLLATHSPPYLSDIPIGLIATAGGSRTAQTLNTMAIAAQALRGWTVPLSVAINQAHLACGEAGTLEDPAIIDQLTRLGVAVASAARRFRTESTPGRARSA